MLKIVKQKMVVGLFLVSIFGPYMAKAVKLSPLMEAIQNEEESKALELIKVSTPDEINWRNDAECTAMDYALWGGNYEIVKALLKNSAKVNELGNSDFMPLGTAVLLTPKKRKKIVELLLANGADPNKKNSVGITPFFSAVSGGNLAVLKLLFTGNIEPDLGVKYNNAWSCLDEAISHENLPVVKLLVEKGANVAECHEVNGTLYNLAEWAEKILKAPEIADYLKPFCPKKAAEEEGKQFDGAKMQCESKLVYRPEDGLSYVAPKPKQLCLEKKVNAVVGLNSSDEQKTLKK